MSTEENVDQDAQAVLYCYCLTHFSLEIPNGVNGDECNRYKAASAQGLHCLQIV